MDWTLIFAVVLFGLGLWIVLDDRGFVGRSRRAIAFVRTAERVETRVNTTTAGGRYKSDTVVTWRTRFAFKDAEGREQVGEDELHHQPGEVMTIWYDRQNPQRSRTVRSKESFGWTLIGTAFIPLGFWVIDFYELLP